MQLSGDMHHTEDVTAVKEVRLTYKGVASLRQICVKKQNSTWKKNHLSTFVQYFVRFSLWRYMDMIQRKLITTEINKVGAF